jgi:TonB-dependent siderophore receptor
MIRVLGIGVLATAVGIVVPLWAEDRAPAADEEQARQEEQAGTDGGTETRREDSGDYVDYVEVNLESLPTSNTIATKMDVPVQLTPASVGTVGAPMMYEQDSVLLGDALANISGLNIQDGSGVHDWFVIRGFDSISSGLVMTDGAAEPNVTYYQLYNVEGVEVFKGPAGFLYGKNALAGAVNLVRKQPLPGNFAVLGGSAGSFGAYEGTLDWNRASTDGDLSFRLNGLWREAENYRDDKQSKHFAVNPGLTWNLGASSSLTFNLEYVGAEYSPDGGLPLYAPDALRPDQLALPEIPRTRSYQAEDDFSDQTLGRFQIDYENRLSDTVLLRNKTYYRDLDWRSNGTLLRGTFQVLPGLYEVVRQQGQLDDRQVHVGNQLEAVLGLRGGGVEHSLLVGLELLYESDEFTFDIVPISDVELFTLEPLNLIPSGPALSSVGDVRNRVIAPYVIDQMKLSSEFQLLIGLRYDSIDHKGDVRPLVSPQVESFSRDDSELSPMAGVVFTPSVNLSVYGQAGRSYAPPSPRLVDEANPAGREPERSTQYEIGVKKQFRAGKLLTTFAVYDLERENIPIRDPNAFTQQSGSQRSRGFEFELAAEPLPRLRTFLSYAFNDSELTQFTRFNFLTLTVEDLSGNRPIMAPRNLATLWVSKSFRNRLGVAGGVRYVDEQFVSEDNLYAIPGYWIVDAAGFYDLKAWRFRLNVKNLTDTQYENRGVAGDSSVIPANPFAVYGSVEYRF